MKFAVASQSGAARCGTLEFRRGAVSTPAFMPVGTYGTVKSVTPEEVALSGAEIILGNTFHLMLRPGTEVVRKHGGLHEFMNWHEPILTDSGGFQVFSLAAMRKLTEDGVKFQSPVNGDEVFLTPERSIEVQHELNADVTMIFDECTPYPASERDAGESMQLSLRWAARSRERFDQLKQAEPERGEALFGIVQGGIYDALREESLAGLTAIGFDGYAIGGLAVGEPEDERHAVLDALMPRMPADRAALPDGRRYAGRYCRSRAARRRHVRLRDSDTTCPQRPAIHVARYGQIPARPVSGRYVAAGPGLRLLHLLQLQPCLSPAPGKVRRDPGAAPGNDP